MSELKLPVVFDDDFDLVDADGVPLMYCADMVDHNPELGAEIAMRVNNYEKLVEALQDVMLIAEEAAMGDQWIALDKARALLAQLQAGKGAER